MLLIGSAAKKQVWHQNKRGGGEGQFSSSSQGTSELPRPGIPDFLLSFFWTPVSPSLFPSTLSTHSSKQTPKSTEEELTDAYNLTVHLWGSLALAQLNIRPTSFC